MKRGPPARFFAVDPALATSLGLSAETHVTLLEMAGFAKTDDVPRAPAVEAEKPEATEAPASEKTAVEPEPAAEPEAPAPTDSEKPDSKEVLPPQYWRWKGMGKANKKNRHSHAGKNPRNDKGQGKGKPKPRKTEPVLATAGGAFAELAALKESMKK